MPSPFTFPAKKIGFQPPISQTKKLNLSLDMPVVDTKDGKVFISLFIYKVSDVKII